jgi:hypothetical protein
MKKIGILFGQEHSFPPAFVERVNAKTGGREIKAEPVRIDKVIQGERVGYDVVIDRISQDVPFYRGWLKNEALTGCAVVNNPFWWSADEKFFNNALATKIGVAVPKTVLLPSHSLPPDTNDGSFRNLAYPLDWAAIFAYVGWPAYFKPFAGGGWKNVYKLNNPDEFFRAYSETGQLVMMLQEEVQFQMYFRCYSIDQRHVRIMNYEPRHPYHLRYQTDWQAPRDILEKVEQGVLTLNRYLGYDLNTVEFAIRDGVPLAIDFCNPAPDAEIGSVGQANFDWVVEAVSEMAIRKAKEHVPGRDNLSWGKYVQAAVTRRALSDAT